MQQPIANNLVVKVQN